MDVSNIRESDEIEIDLWEVLAVLWHNLWLIILSGILVGVAAFLISNFLITETYKATTTIYILNKDNSGNGTITYSDVQLGTQLTKDYVQMITSRSVLEKVIVNNDLNETYGSLYDKTSVQLASDTRIISITVTEEDPAMAQYLADEIRKVAADRIQEVMNIEAVNTVDEANLPTTPAAPNVKKWAAIGFLLGAFACVGIILVRFMLDDTIKTSDDVERYLGISVLGTIPTKEEEDHRKKHKSKKGKKSGSASLAKERSGSDLNASTEEREEELEEIAAAGRELQENAGSTPAGEPQVVEPEPIQGEAGQEASGQEDE